MILSKPVRIEGVVEYILLKYISKNVTVLEYFVMSLVFLLTTSESVTVASFMSAKVH